MNVKSMVMARMDGALGPFATRRDRAVYMKGAEVTANVVSHAFAELQQHSILGRTAREVVRWQRATFAQRVPSGLVAHLRQEIDELAADPADAEELADCLIILIGIADAAGVGVEGLEVALAAKLEKNKRRKWHAPDPDTGIIQHSEEASDA